MEAVQTELRLDVPREAKETHTPLLTPEKDEIQVAVVLGERAAALAETSDLPQAIKTLIRETRPYAEGRGIRFAIQSAAEVPVVLELVKTKLKPK
jgi:hypothetical protein